MNVGKGSIVYQVQIAGDGEVEVASFEITSISSTQACLRCVEPLDVPRVMSVDQFYRSYYGTEGRALAEYSGKAEREYARLADLAQRAKSRSDRARQMALAIAGVVE